MGQLPNNEIPQNRQAQLIKQGEITMADSRQKCELCHGLGQFGARYLVKTADGKTVRVHKPCGEQLVASAPPEVKAQLVPSQELKNEWAAKRTQRQAKDFWAEKCPQLLEIKKSLEQKEKDMK